MLECGHVCKGTCGSCFSGTLHIPCKEPCENFLECGHKCKKLCGEYCGICHEKCETFCFCRKTRCDKNCYDTCDKCTKKCSFSCEHQECTLFCNEICINEPCNWRCEKILPKCGHQCSGLCGEICPSRCLNCDFEVKGEKANDLPIIQMKCNHFITVRELDFLMEKQALPYFFCPECSSKTPIELIKRYQKIVKKQREKHNDYKELKIKMLLEKYENVQIDYYLLQPQSKLKFSALESILFNREMKYEVFSKLKDIDRSDKTKDIHLNSEKNEFLKEQIKKLKDTYFNQEAIDLSEKQWNMIKNKIFELKTMKDL